MMVDTIFNFLIDNDFFIDDPHGFSKLFGMIPYDNKLYGYACNFGSKNHTGSHHLALCDNTGILMYPRVKHLKLMFQFNLWTYSGGEDIQISLINYILCGVETRRYSFAVTSSTLDEYQSRKDKPRPPKPSFNNISHFVRRAEFLAHNGFWNCYNYYIEQGFVPVWYRKKEIKSKS